ncbi:antibiotic biosynthesis monooxygenase [Streptomyces inusitatus]|uniref:Antibiotic biosynthesis monooxygenase n=1 Tax=Streptomyces inusitatus TaxID=68221 RepID=A0A918UXV4_9ACTN|nr:antibiotic biosynthesis monooxygenase [Streptomyces inusitatus]GGZ43850.1 antibiotic biosynthesis monooxygenase [Streptomyces inusitatus]
MPEPVIVRPGARPELSRPDAGVIKVSTWDVGDPGRQRAALDAIGRAWLGRDWPDGGLLSYTVHLGEDGRTLLHYSQWADEDAYRRFFDGPRDRRNAEIDAAVPGIRRLALDSYELYRSHTSREDDPRVPGCVVIVEVEFEGPDPERQRGWVDTVLSALASDPATAPGGGAPDGGGERDPRTAGISGSFHLGADGRRVLNYAEWESAELHRAALASPGFGIGAATEEWERVAGYPGVREGRVNRYTPGLSLGPGV